MELYGLSKIHIELSSRCNKHCHICGRRKTNYQGGDISLDFLRLIAKELPPDIIVATHWNGESMLHPYFGEAIRLLQFARCITNTVTNGKLIIEKFDEIVDNLDTMSISIFEGDPEQDDQYQLIEEFLNRKGDRIPYTTLRLIGQVPEDRYAHFGATIVKRTLHSPMGSFEYKKSPTIPEHGICQDLLNTLAIDHRGNVSLCVRFDPDGQNVIGNLNYNTLSQIWNSQERRWIRRQHILGHRDQVRFCNKCEFYGVPTSS